MQKMATQSALASLIFVLPNWHSYVKYHIQGGQTHIRGFDKNATNPECFFASWSTKTSLKSVALIGLQFNEVARSHGHSAFLRINGEIKPPESLNSCL
jgi:hypothetical protein